MCAMTSSSASRLKKKPGVPDSHSMARIRSGGLSANRHGFPPPSPLKLLVLCCFLVAFASAAVAFSQSSDSILPGPKPADTPAQWKKWIGDYGGPFNVYIVSDTDGKILITLRTGTENSTKYRLLEKIPIPDLPSRPSKVQGFQFKIGMDGSRELVAGDVRNRQLDYGVDSGHVARIHPTRPIADVRREALAATPPAEKGPFRKPDLAELAPLDPAIHLDIRYATSNDFLGTPVYTQARAFLQRPAAEALLRVLRKLEPLGYGLLIHDAYRPWYVTKIFWDATPPEGKIFVADPAQGSRHNRGCAVDLTLYDLKTGHPVEMPGTYDEMSPRSYPDYPGGTSLQRWHRDLLRRAMESEGFTVYDYEWWHFDYKDWREYPILNIPFENLKAYSN
jgi:D-alanyl-D-alanine dipeptidase